MDLTKFGFTTSAKKKAKEEEEKKAKKKSYESKRERTFQSNWLEEFSGLKYATPINEAGEPDDSKDCIMICTVCLQNSEFADRNCSMYNGTNAFRKDTLVAHWKSVAHRRCEEKWKQNEKMTIDSETASTSGASVMSSSGPIVRIVKNMEKDSEMKIIRLFTTVYFVCKHENPFTDYPKLIMLQEINGLDMGNFYRSDNACRRFVKYIYDDLFNGYLKTIDSVNFFSILIHGATDVSVTENELIYLRYVDKGVPVNHYFSIEDIAHAHAQGILNTMDQSFARKGLQNWKEKLIGFGSDGASVNLGICGGIAALIKQDIPYLVITHCVAHKLELAVNSAIKNHKLMKDVQDLLQYLYKHYQYSPKALRELRQLGEALEEKILKPTKLAGTRWLPHIYRALDVLSRNYKVLLTHFEHIRESRTGSSEVQGRATFISKKLKTYKFLYTVYFILDVLKVLNVLSLKMQRDDLTLSDMFDSLAATHLSLIELKTEDGQELSKFVSAVNYGTGTYQGINLSGIAVDVTFNNDKRVIIDMVTAALDDRFSSMEKDPILHAAATVINFSDWPKTLEGLARYCNPEIGLILEEFRDVLENRGCDLDAIMNQEGEWKDFKSYVFRHNTTLTVDNFFIFPELRQRFKNMILCLEMLLTFPLSSVVCERGFSAMKRIKFDWRSSLQPKMLRMLMHIVIEGPEVAVFNAQSAFDLWWSSGRQKRPGFNPNEFKSSLPIDIDEPEETDEVEQMIL